MKSLDIRKADIKMHLVIITAELATAGNSCGGSASFASNLARIFQRNGHRVTVVLITTKEEEVAFDPEITVKTAYVEKSLWDKYDDLAEITSVVTGEDKNEIRKYLVNLHKGKLAKRIVDEIRQKEKIDIIHSSNICGLSLELDDEIPYVVRISSYYNMLDYAETPNAIIDYDQSPISIKGRLEVYMLQKARYLISPSNILADIGRTKIGINPTVIESPFVLDRENWDNSIYDSLIKGKKYIIHCGRMSYAKGTHIVAQISKQILEKYSDMFIVLAGNDIEMELENGEVVKGHELVVRSAQEYANRIIYAGCLSREQLYPLLQHAEICLLPSRIENLSNTCIEAMAMGTIVIGTNGASFEQLIDDRVSGFLCKRDDPDSFMQAVEEALDMDEEAKDQMFVRSAQRIRQLAPDIIYNKYLEFYRKVIGEWNNGGIAKC